MIMLDEGGLGASDARRAPVPDDLRQAVEGIWVLFPRPSSAGAATASVGGWRVVADPNAHLLLHRLLDGRVRFTVVGARSRFIDVHPGDRDFTVGARLAVGALPLLTSVPAADFVDVGVHASDLFGAAGRTATAEAHEAATPSRAVAVVTGLLRRCLSRRASVDWRVRGLMAHLRHGPGRRLGSVADDLGVSARTLRSTTREHVGLGPKDVQRVHRLLRSLIDMRTGTPGATAALTAGFVDQAHLTHECVAFLGEPPGRFLARGRRRFLQGDVADQG